MQKISALMLLISMLVCIGCDSGVNERSYELSPQQPAIEKVIALLEGYRDGQPLGSEVTGLQSLIPDLKDGSGRAAIVQEAFDKLMDSTNTGNAAAIASETLGKLQN